MEKYKSNSTKAVILLLIFAEVQDRDEIKKEDDFKRKEDKGNTQLKRADVCGVRVSTKLCF